MSSCFCGSNKKYDDCCRKFSEIFENKEINIDDLLLIDWIKNISGEHQASFIDITQKYFYRISLYFENILSIFNGCSLTDNSQLNETVFNIRLNINHSILSSATLMAQGLFLQSGILHRAAFEDIFVIIDFVEDSNQFEKFLNRKYDTNKILSRIKDYIPEDLARWYGYFTANFTHFCEIHATPFIPRKCHADNFITVLSFKNLMRLLVAYHIVLERIYFSDIQSRSFWHQDDKGRLVIDWDSSPIFKWIDDFGKEIENDFNPIDRKQNMIYSEKTYTFR